MLRILGSSSLVFALALCGSGESDGSDETTGAESADPTTAVDTESGSSGAGEGESESDATASGGEDDAGFVSDMIGDASYDPWEQDCPEGEKCAHYSAGAPGGNANKCVPIAEDPKTAGDECDGSGIASGIDECDLGMYCSFLDENAMGICIEMCSGAPANPICPEASNCSIDNDGTLISCTASCDPLVQDCAAEVAICMPAAGIDGFNCATGWGSGAIGVDEECIYSNSCAEGLFCNYDPSGMPNRPGGAQGCCSPYCDLSQNDGAGNNPACDGLGQGVTCNSWWGDTPAPGYELVGGCWVPT